MNEGTIYEIPSIKAPKVETTMLVYGEARNTIINLIIGKNVQTYIKIRASDLVQVLEEMGIVKNPQQLLEDVLLPEAEVRF